MKVLVGVASHETQHVYSIQSCYAMRRKPQDRFEIRLMPRGDMVRQEYANIILADNSYGDDDALLLLDGDQKHPADMLERLRSHDLDMVCAHYYRRDEGRIQSMCFELDDWNIPLNVVPKEGLHEIGTTGFGCVLIKKKVLRDMREITPPRANMMETDFTFFNRARGLGYRLWLDASLNSDHAVIVWLDHKTAERLKNG